MKMNQTKRLTVLVLALLVLLPCFSLAEDGTVTEKDGWHFDEKGFLAGEDNPGDEYLLEDEQNGVWQYASANLSVKVTRFREKTKKNNASACCIDRKAVY